MNNKRLLVTGTRAHMPDQAPLPQHAPEDHTWLWIWIPIAVFWILIITIITVSLTRSKARPCRRRRPKHEPKADTQEFRIITPTSQES